MRLEHLYWIAGFLDGEGSFGYNGSPLIQVSSTDEDLIERYIVYSKLATIILKTIPPQHTGLKIQYKVSFSGNLAIQWMMTLYPLLCQRRKDRIKDVILQWMAADKANEMKTHCPKGHPYSGRNLIIDTSSGSRRCRICKNNATARWKRRLYA